MLTSNGNAAYDLSLYDESLRKTNTKEPVGKHVRSSKAMKLKRLEHTSSLKMPNALQTVVGVLGKELIAVVCAFFVGFVVFFAFSLSYQAKENELTANIEKAQKQLTTLQNDYQGLMIRYDTLMSDSAIEEYAINNLGMQKRENYQVKWITIGNEQDFDTENSSKGGFLDFIGSYFD